MGLIGKSLKVWGEAELGGLIVGGIVLVVALVVVAGMKVAQGSSSSSTTAKNINDFLSSSNSA